MNIEYDFFTRNLYLCAKYDACDIYSFWRPDTFRAEQ